MSEFDAVEYFRKKLGEYNNPQSRHEKIMQASQAKRAKLEEQAEANRRTAEKYRNSWAGQLDLDVGTFGHGLVNTAAALTKGGVNTYTNLTEAFDGIGQQIDAANISDETRGAYNRYKQGTATPEDLDYLNRKSDPNTQSPLEQVENYLASIELSKIRRDKLNVDSIHNDFATQDLIAETRENWDKAKDVFNNPNSDILDKFGASWGLIKDTASSLVNNPTAIRDLAAEQGVRTAAAMIPGVGMGVLGTEAVGDATRQINEGVMSYDGLLPTQQKQLESTGWAAFGAALDAVSAGGIAGQLKGAIKGTAKKATKEVAEETAEQVGRLKALGRGLGNIGKAVARRPYNASKELVKGFGTEALTGGIQSYTEAQATNSDWNWGDAYTAAVLEGAGGLGMGGIPAATGALIRGSGQTKNKVVKQRTDDKDTDFTTTFNTNKKHNLVKSTEQYINKLDKDSKPEDRDNTINTIQSNIENTESDIEDLITDIDFITEGTSAQTLEDKKKVFDKYQEVYGLDENEDFVSNLSELQTSLVQRLGLKPSQDSGKILKQLQEFRTKKENEVVKAKELLSQLQEQQSIAKGDTYAFDPTKYEGYSKLSDEEQDAIQTKDKQDWEANQKAKRKEEARIATLSVDELVNELNSQQSQTRQDNEPILNSFEENKDMSSLNLNSSDSKQSSFNFEEGLNNPDKPSPEYTQAKAKAKERVTLYAKRIADTIINDPSNVELDSTTIKKIADNKDNDLSDEHREYLYAYADNQKTQADLLRYNTEHGKDLAQVNEEVILGGKNKRGVIQYLELLNKSKSREYARGVLNEMTNFNRNHLSKSKAMTEAFDNFMKTGKTYQVVRTKKSTWGVVSGRALKPFNELRKGGGFQFSENFSQNASGFVDTINLENKAIQAGYNQALKLYKLKFGEDFASNAIEKGIQAQKRTWEHLPASLRAEMEALDNISNTSQKALEEPIQRDFESTKVSTSTPSKNTVESDLKDTSNNTTKSTNESNKSNIDSSKAFALSGGIVGSNLSPSNNSINSNNSSRPKVDLGVKGSTKTHDVVKNAVPRSKFVNNEAFNTYKGEVLNQITNLKKLGISLGNKGVQIYIPESKDQTDKPNMVETALPKGLKDFAHLPYIYAGAKANLTNDQIPAIDNARIAIRKAYADAYGLSRIILKSAKDNADRPNVLARRRIFPNFTAFNEQRKNKSDFKDNDKFFADVRKAYGSPETGYNPKTGKASKAFHDWANNIDFSKVPQFNFSTEAEYLNASKGSLHYLDDNHPEYEVITDNVKAQLEANPDTFKLVQVGDNILGLDITNQKVINAYTDDNFDIEFLNEYQANQVNSVLSGNAVEQVSASSNTDINTVETKEDIVEPKQDSVPEYHNDIPNLEQDTFIPETDEVETTQEEQQVPTTHSTTITPEETNIPQTYFTKQFSKDTRDTSETIKTKLTVNDIVELNKQGIDANAEDALTTVEQRRLAKESKKDTEVEQEAQSIQEDNSEEAELDTEADILNNQSSSTGEADVARQNVGASSVLKPLVSAPISEDTPYTKKQLVTAYFKQSNKVDENGGVNKPLAIVKNFMSRIKDGSISWKAFLPEDKWEDFDKVKHLFNYFELAHDNLKESILKVFSNKRSKEFYYADSYLSDLAMYLHTYDQNGNPIVEENVVTAMAQSMITWVAENKGKINEPTERSIRGILGLPNGTNIHYDLYKLFKNKGVPASFITGDLGRKATKALGLKLVDTNAPMDLMQKMEHSLGGYTLGVLENLGVVVKTDLKANDIKGKYPNYKGEDIPLYTINANKLNILFDSKRISKNDLDYFFTLFKQSKGMIDTVFDSESSQVIPPSLEPINNTQTKAKGTSRNITEFFKQVINKKGKEENYIDTDLYYLAKRMGKEAVLKLGGWKTPEQLAKVPKNLRNSEEVKNNKLEYDFDNYISWVEDYLAGTDKGLATPFYFNSEVWQQDRMGMVGNLFNPQASKLHRAMHYQKAWIHTIDMNNEADYKEYRLTLAESLGVNLDQNKSPEALPKLDKIIASEVFQKASDAMIKHLKDKTLTESDVQSLIEFGKEFEAHYSLVGLKAYATEQLAKEEGKTSFKTTLFGETDGVNNGPLLFHLVHGIVSGSSNLTSITLDQIQTVLNKGGFFLKGQDLKNYNDFRSKLGNRDFYETYTYDFGKALLDAINNFMLKAEGKTVDKNALQLDPQDHAVISSVFGDLLNQDNETVTKDGRNFAKLIVPPIIFGSGRGSTVESVSQSFSKAVFEKLGDYQDANEAVHYIGGIFDLVSRQFSKNQYIQGVLRNTWGRLNQEAQQNGMQGVLDFEFSEVFVQALEQSFAKTWGKVLADVAQKQYGLLKEVQTTMSVAGELNFNLFNAIYNRMLNDYMESLNIPKNEKGEFYHGLSAKQKVAFQKKIEKYIPRLETTSSYVENNHSAAIPMYMTTKGRSNLSTARASSHIQRDNNLIFTRTVEGSETVLKSPGVALAPFSTHSMDSWIMYTTALEQDLMSAHDAGIVGVLSRNELAQSLNENTIKAALQNSPQHQTLVTTLSNLGNVGYLFRKGVLKLEDLESISNSLMRSSQVKDPTTGKYEERFNEANAAILESVLRSIRNGLFSDLNKLSSIKNMSSVNQYAKEGGAYDAEGKHDEAIQKRLEELADYYNVTIVEKDGMYTIKENVEDLFYYFFESRPNYEYRRNILKELEPIQDLFQYWNSNTGGRPELGKVPSMLSFLDNKDVEGLHTNLLYLTEEGTSSIPSFLNTPQPVKDLLDKFNKSRVNKEDVAKAHQQRTTEFKAKGTQGTVLKENSYTGTPAPEDNSNTDIMEDTVVHSWSTPQWSKDKLISELQNNVGTAPKELISPLAGIILEKLEGKRIVIREIANENDLLAAKAKDIIDDSNEATFKDSYGLNILGKGIVNGKVQTINYVLFNTMNGQRPPNNIIVHELIHAFFNHRYTEPDIENDPHYSALLDLYDLVHDELKPKVDSGAFKNKVINDTVKEAISNFDEFIAYGLTDANFVEILKEIKVDNTVARDTKQHLKGKQGNAFNNFVKGIINFVFGRSKNAKRNQVFETALAELIYHTSFVLGSQVGMKPESTVVAKPTTESKFKPTPNQTTLFAKKIKSKDKVNQETDKEIRKEGEKLVEAVENMTSDELLSQLSKPNTELSDAFNKHLDNIYKDIVQKTYAPIVKAKMKEEGISAGDAFIRSIQQGGKETLSEALDVNIPLSEKESLIIESVEAVLTESFTNNDRVKASIAFNELQVVWNEARQEIKPEDLFDGNWDKATVEEQEQAQKLHDFLFRVPDHTKGFTQAKQLAKFTALVLGSETVNHFLTKKSLKTVNKAKKPKTIYEKLLAIFDTILSWFSDKATNTHKGQRYNNRILNLAEKLASIESKYKKHVLQKNVEKVFDAFGKNVDKIQKKGHKQLKKAFTSDFFQESSTSFIKAFGKLGEVIVKDEVDGTIEKWINERNRSVKHLHGIVADTINYMRKPREAFQDLLAANKKLQGIVKQYKETSASQLLKAFNNEGKDLKAKEKSAITQVFLRTGMHFIQDSYSMNELLGFVRGETLDNEINYLKDTLSTLLGKDQHIFHFYTNQAEDLGYYLQHGGNSRNAHQLMNASAIANFVGLNNFKFKRPNQETIDEAIPIIEKLITLESLKASNSNQRAIAAKVLEKELSRKDKQNGIEFAMKFHRMAYKEAKEKLFDTEAMGYAMIHGYLSEITDDTITFQMATKEEGRKLELLGYTRVNDQAVYQDPTDIHKQTKYMYILKDSGLQSRPTASVSLVDVEAKGTRSVGKTSIDGRTNKQKNINLALQRNKAKAIDSLFYKRPHRSGRERPVKYQIPVIGPDGQITDYRYTMHTAVLDKYFSRNNDFDNLLATTASSSLNKLGASKQNRLVVDTLLQDYKESFNKEPSAFVKVSRDSKDPEIKEIYEAMPNAMRLYVRELFGSDHFYIRKSQVNMVFGYRLPSLSDIFTPKAKGILATVLAQSIEYGYRQYAKEFKKLNNEDAKIFAQRAARHIRIGEDWVHAGVGILKNTIVIKTGTVLVGNIWSNLTVLRIMGVGLDDILKDQLVAYRGLAKYRKDRDELTRLTNALDSGYLTKPKKEIEDRIKILNASIENNPVYPLIEAGLMQTIVEDVEMTGDDFSASFRAKRKLDELGDKLPSFIKPVAKNIFMTEDTAMFKVLNSATQYSDFVAKYALYKHLTTRKNEPLSHKQAISTAMETFVNYDIPLPPKLSYLDTMGITMFIKYALSMQRVLFNTAVNRPLQTLMVMHLNDILNAPATVMGSSWLNPMRWGNNPLEWSVLALPTTIDDIVTLEAFKGLVK